MREKLSRVCSRWRRLMIASLLNVLLLLNKLMSPRARIHWIGHYRRPRRFERLIAVAVFVSAMLILKGREFAVWAAVSGSSCAFFISFVSLYRLIPRKRYHWLH